MNQDIKRRWVADLRANGDKQGRSYLNRHDKFCCLGRLCELAVEDGVIPPAVAVGDDFPMAESGVYAYDGATTLPPFTVYDWAGMTPRLDEIRAGDLITNLVRMNDNGLTFAQIADLIDEQL